MSSEATTQQGDVVVQVQVPDIYGQIHPIETDELLQTKHDEFMDALRMIPNHKKHNVVLAYEKCPQIVSSKKFIRLFLRCEVYNVHLAVHRFLQYWDKRIELFGINRAYQEFTLQSMIDGKDTIVLEMGIMNLIERTNDRTYMYFDPSKQDRTKYTKESFVRCFWYLLHKALLLSDDDDTTTTTTTTSTTTTTTTNNNNNNNDNNDNKEEIQKKGLIIIINPYNAKFKQFDKNLPPMIVQSIQGCLPIRLSAIHICHPPTFFRILFPIISALMSSRTRKRILVHSGSISKVVHIVTTQYNFKIEDIPIDMGGTHVNKNPLL